MPVVIDYTSKDYAAFRSDMLDSAFTKLPEWRNREPSDFGVLLVDIFAEGMDRLSFYGDRIANEAFIQTAVLRSSVLKHAEMLGYTPAGVQSAVTTLQFTIDASMTDVLIPAGTKVSTPAVSNETAQIMTPIVFETDEDLTIPGGGTVTEAVAATQGETYTEQLGVSNGSVDQTFALGNKGSVKETIVVTVDEGAGPVEWTFAEYMIETESADEVFSLYIDEYDITYIRFGDNVNGRVPANDAIVSATYRVSVGAAGNLPSGYVTNMVSPTTGVVSVSNTTSGAGGSDAESLDDIRQNALKSLRTLERAVTLQDYADLAVGLARVAKASATGTATDPVVHVAPVGGGAPTASLLTEVVTFFDDKKMINATVTADGPTYQDVDVTASVHVREGYGREQVRIAAETALKTLLGFDNQDFGADVRLGDVYAMLVSIPGVEYAVVTLLADAGGTGATDVAIATTEIAQEGTITLTASGGIV